MIIMNYGDGRIETECKERNLSERGIVGEDLGDLGRKTDKRMPSRNHYRVD